MHACVQKQVRTFNDALLWINAEVYDVYCIFLTFMRKDTSDSGLFQFSVEKAYSVTNYTDRERAAKKIVSVGARTGHHKKSGFGYQ